MRSDSSSSSSSYHSSNGGRTGGLRTTGGHYRHHHRHRPRLRLHLGPAPPSPSPGNIPRAAEPTGLMHPSPFHTHASHTRRRVCAHTPTHILTYTPTTHTRGREKYPDVPDWLATHRPPMMISHGVQASRRPKTAVDVSLREPLTRRAPTRQQPQPGVPQPSTPRQSR